MTEYPQHALPEAQASEENFHPIIWLASYPKSGNTFLRILLAYYLFGRNLDWKVDLNALGKIMPGDSSPLLFSKLAGKPIKQVTPKEVHKLRKQYQQTLTQYPRTLFVKTHSGYYMDAEGYHIYPEYTGGAVLIVRDPRDVACSVMQHFGYTADEAVAMLCDSERCLGRAPGTANAADYIWTRMGDWGQHARSWAALEKRCLLVHYEELRRSPVNFLAAFSRWAGTPYDRKAALKAVRESRLEKLREREAKEGFVEASAKADRFFGRGQVGGWRDKLTGAQVDRMWEKFGDTATGLGYER